MAFNRKYISSITFEFAQHDLKLLLIQYKTSKDLFFKKWQDSFYILKGCDLNFRKIKEKKKFLYLKKFKVFEGKIIDGFHHFDKELTYRRRELKTRKNVELWDQRSWWFIVIRDVKSSKYAVIIEFNFHFLIIIIIHQNYHIYTLIFQLSLYIILFQNLWQK